MSLLDRLLGKNQVDPALEFQLRKRGMTEKLEELKGFQNKTSVNRNIAKSALEVVSAGVKRSIKDTGELVSDLKNTAGDIIRTVPRAVARVGLQLSGVKESKPKTLAEKLVLGFEPIKNVEGEGASILQNFGVGKEKAQKYGLPLGVALTATDLIPFGGGKKAVTKNISKETEEYIAKQIFKKTSATSSGNKTVLKKTGDFLKQIKSDIVDSASPIEDAIANAQKKYKFEVLPKYDITNQIDRVLRAPTIAGQFIKDNGLEQVIKQVDDVERFDQYLIARQARDVAKNGIKTGRDTIMDERILTELGESYEPLAKQVTSYTQKLLDYSVESGLIDKNLGNKLKEIYPNYVPLNRVFSELEKDPGFGTKAVASLSKQSIVRRIEGSTREIESPLTAILAKTNDAFVQGEKNKAAKILAGYKDLPGMEGLIKELPKGVSSTNTFSYLENGVKRTFEATPEIASAAKSLDVQQLGLLGKVLSVPVRLAKLGITGINLPFVLTNVFRDQIFSVITSNKALKTSIANPSVFLQSLFSAAKHDDLYQELVRQGAGGTSFDIARNQAAKTIEQINGKRITSSKIKYTANKVTDLFRAIEDIIGRSEEFTRIQQFKGTKDALLSQGRTLEDATILAAKAARENTANFFRKGNWGKVLNNAFLYLNAGIQGSRSFIKALERDPKGTATKVATVLFMPTAAATAWNLSDENRKKAYEDIKEYEKEGNIIIIPPNPIKDEQNNWNVIKIPLPPGVGKLASLVRRGIEQTQGLDPIKFSEFANTVIGSVSPIEPNKRSLASTLIPQAIKPSIESLSNYSFFSDRPLIPQSLEKLSPENQVRPYTSGTARKIGGVIDVSPIKVEEFIKGTFGSGLASQVINLTDRALAGLEIIPKDQIGGRGLIDAITSRFSKATGGDEEQKSAQKIRDVIARQSDDRFLQKQEAELLHAELKNLPKDEANQKVLALRKENPILYRKLKELIEEEKLGLDYNDRLIKQLGVENGERARFIFEAVEQFESREEKNQYILELRKKKIITDTVYKQLKELIAEKK